MICQYKSKTKFAISVFNQHTMIIIVLILDGENIELLRHKKVAVTSARRLLLLIMCCFAAQTESHNTNGNNLSVMAFIV